MPKRVGTEQPSREKRAVLSLVQNRTFFDLCKAVEAKFTKQWRSSKTTAEREEVFFKLRGLDAVYAEMKARIDRGTVAEVQADQAKRKAAELGETAERQSPALALDKRKR